MCSGRAEELRGGRSARAGFYAGVEGWSVNEPEGSKWRFVVLFGGGPHVELDPCVGGWLLYTSTVACVYSAVPSAIPFLPGDKWLAIAGQHSAVFEWGAQVQVWCRLAFMLQSLVYEDALARFVLGALAWGTCSGGASLKFHAGLLMYKNQVHSPTAIAQRPPPLSPARPTLHNRMQQVPNLIPNQQKWHQPHHRQNRIAPRHHLPSSPQRVSPTPIPPRHCSR